MCHIMMNVGILRLRLHVSVFRDTRDIPGDTEVSPGITLLVTAPYLSPSLLSNSSGASTILLVMPLRSLWQPHVDEVCGALPSA